MNIQDSGNARSHRIGLLAIIAVWLSGPMTVPAVKILKPNFSAEEILFVRSLFCFAVAFAFTGNSALRADWKVKLSGLVIGLSSISFYRALQAWDVNPVMVVLALMPVINMTIARIEGKKISPIAIISFALLLGGITLALEPWNRPINPSGLFWSLGCVILGGIGTELWAKSPETSTVSEKCFWFAGSLLVVTPLIIYFTQSSSSVDKYLEPRSMLWLLNIGVMNGILYTFCTMVPFSKVGKMNTVVGTVLLQGSTPANIIGAYLLVGESMTHQQIGGLVLALSGATLLSVWTVKNGKSQKPA